MHHHYNDIRSRSDEKPSWFDEYGTPRYGEFSPRATANIYTEEAVLLLIACQSCGREFRVCMTWDVFDKVARGTTPLSEQVADDTIHYGDPPNIECCPAGPSMNSVPRRVLEFWRYDSGLHDMVRVAELEHDIACAWWAKDEA
jgi:hypothetical protein